MALREIFNSTQTRTALAQAVRTASANGVTIDTGGSSGGFGGVSFIHTIGTQGVTLDGTNNITLTIQDSDNGTTWNNAADTDVLTNSQVGNPQSILLNANSLANRVHRQAYIGPRRFVRAVHTFAGTHGTGTSTSCVAVLSHSTLKPAPDLA